MKFAQLFATPWTIQWNSPCQNTGVGSLSLIQGIFPTQGSNPGLPHCRLILYQLSHKGRSGILEWVAPPFSIRSSWPRNQIRVSYIAGGFFTNWAIREAPKLDTDPQKVSAFLGLSVSVDPLDSQCPYYLCSLFLINWFLTEILCVWKLFSNPFSNCPNTYHIKYLGPLMSLIDSAKLSKWKLLQTAQRDYME